MSKLPGEILVLLADYLTFTEKAKLERVCKSWNDILTQTTLYKQHIFKRWEGLDKTVELFNKKLYIKQHVRDLVIFSMEYDMQTVVALAILFPNITSLEWRDYLKRQCKAEGPSMKLIYAHTLQQWKNIESLIDCTNHLNIATHLLDNTKCDKLTRLHVAFDDHVILPQHCGRITYETLLQDLLKNIHNAPSLEDAHFSGTAPKLMDMENLHISLPKLKSVFLDDVGLYNDDMMNNATAQISQKPLESFLLR